MIVDYVVPSYSWIVSSIVYCVIILYIITDLSPLPELKEHTTLKKRYLEVMFNV